MMAPPSSTRRRDWRRAPRTREGRHWLAQTVVAALRLDGITAPAVFDGPIDNASFLARDDETRQLALDDRSVGDFRWVVPPLIRGGSDAPGRPLPIIGIRHFHILEIRCRIDRCS
jgi:hypothetical protein